MWADRASELRQGGSASPADPVACVAGLLTERNRDVCVSLGEMRVVDESVGSELHAPVAVGDLGCFPEPFGLRIREEEDE